MIQGRTAFDVKGTATTIEFFLCELFLKTNRLAGAGFFDPLSMAIAQEVNEAAVEEGTSTAHFLERLKEVAEVIIEDVERFEAAIRDDPEVLKKLGFGGD